MKTKKIFSIILVISMVLTSSSLIFAKETNYDDRTREYKSLKISNGYGLAGRSSMRITRGATCEFKIDTPVKCVTQKEIVELIKENISNFSQEELSILKKDISFNYEGFGSRLFCGLFGTKFNSSIFDYKNAHNKEIIPSDTSGRNLINAIYNLEEKDYRITGTVCAGSNSYIPTQPYAFIEVTVIEFEDGKKIRVINTNSVVAEGDGTRDIIKYYKKYQPLYLITEN
ncbi:hypothetical protein SH1V18_33610 [Vallitalea longa]|uniref:Uncharacterized protein n=1 Tax=Vallitalea longa TaxID=2936439 RepID=A0A9W5YDY7_9FIRM|nr:hypothetical protein [Vallitalea longa]GKX30881.1 hypothetical protein SH1V18_33610 [Vallitalea longa]